MLSATDIEKIRSDFPILHQYAHGKPLVYLDNAATTQKPKVVIDRLKQYYSQENANVHRGLHYLSQLATDAYEEARQTVQHFIHASSPDEIIFVRGTTEAINLVAHSFSTSFKPGDEILLSAMEHHANIVPWQILAERIQAKLRIIPMNQSGELILENLDEFLTERTRLVTVVHISNAIGTINPVKTIIDKAHAKNISVLLDGAQSVSHLKIDVQALNCDFFAFSGHKLYGPTGIGVLYGKRHLLAQMPPFQGGGEMIRSVSFTKTEYNDVPYKFEAGTPHIAGAIGLAEAIRYVTGIGLDAIAAYEQQLYQYCLQQIQALDRIKQIGTAQEHASIFSFIMDDVHAHDIGTIVDQEGVAIRSGHHCAMPIMDFFGIPASARASIAFYNNQADIDRFIQALQRVREVFS